MNIKQVTHFLEQFAPLYYQEEYDNSGLIIGDDSEEITGVLITLDCTEDVIDEAIVNGCNLIISHHPIIFRGLKKLNGSNYIERTVIKAIKNNISIYAIHTNLDNVYNGVNGRIAERLKLKNCKILAPKSDLLRQLVVYCPVTHSSELKSALYESGAGKIGDYENCSFSFVGKGTYKALDGAKPFSGKVGVTHTEKEERIEVVFPKYKESVVLSAMQTHPYEEVAYQIFRLENKHPLVGSGIIGELEAAVESKIFLKNLKDIMQVNTIKHTCIVNETISRVAVCGGSGSFLLEKAKQERADIYISADFRYHDFFNAENDIIIADIGHYESEQFTKDLIYDLLSKKFTKFAIQLSKVNTNPINYL